MNIVDGGFLEPNRLKNVHIHGHKLDCPHFMAFSGGEHDVCPQPCRASQGLSNGSTGRPAERRNRLGGSSKKDVMNYDTKPGYD